MIEFQKKAITMTNYSRLTEIVCKIFDETIIYDKVSDKSILLVDIVDDIYDEYKKDKADKAFENFYKRDLSKLVDWHILEKIETTTSSSVEISYKLHERLNYLYKSIIEDNFTSYDISYMIILNNTAVKINKFDKDITNSILENQGFGSLVHLSIPTNSSNNSNGEPFNKSFITKFLIEEKNYYQKLEIKEKEDLDKSLNQDIELDTIEFEF
jgi:hypothetical protein